MSDVAVPTRPMIPLSEPNISESAWQHIKSALDSGWVSSVGPYVDRFEAEMAAYHGVAKTIATINGTAALHVALILGGVGPGDEVILPSMTFIATANAVAYTGATPVFWDSSDEHFNADPARLEALITDKTKAIVPVHLYGQPVEMDAVLAIARKHGLWVVEDAAEALGAFWDGKPCGTLGDVGCLSFNGNKIMTTGGGGLMISPDEALMERARYFVNQAKDDAVAFVHDNIGYNYRLSNIHAALGVAQFEQFTQWLACRKTIFQRYERALTDHPALISFSPPEKAESACWLYAVALDETVLPGKTSMDIVHALAPLGVQARPFFRPIHQQKPFAPFAKQPCSNAEKWYRTGFNLPSSSQLSEADQAYVIESVLQVLNGWQAKG